MDTPTVEKPAATLLYVEDDHLTQELVIRILRRRFPQINIVMAGNGKDGFELYTTHHPEIVVTDIRMPMVDGIKMAKKIKKLDKDAQIIVLTASDETNNILEAIDIGINNYVLKPINVQKLIRAIELCLDRISIREQLKQKEEYISRMAYYDHLTGLPNRQLFNEFFHKALAHASRNKLLLAVFFIDLDGFKKINDTLGHSTGDHLLKAVAERLKECCSREQDTVARWGGDEFIILLTDLEVPQEATRVAQKINEAFLQPLALLNHNLTISISIGISLFPDNGMDAETLIKHADAAMYCAKNKSQQMGNKGRLNSLE